MKTTIPIELSQAEWSEIASIPTIRELWGLQPDEGGEFFAKNVYAAKFDFSSGGPGYIGPMFVLVGDAITAPPTMVIRDSSGALKVAEF